MTVRPLVCLVLAVVAGCGGGGGGTQPQPQPPPPAQPPPPPAPITQTIGPAGGTINGPAGVVLTIPADALTSDTPITISIDGTGAPSLANAGQAVGSLVSITPHGLTFGVPITLSLPFDPAQLPAGEEPTLFKTNARNDGWQQLVTQRSGSVLTASATGFSWIGIRCCIAPPDLILDEPDDQTVPEGGFAFFRVEPLQRPRDPQIPILWFRNGLPMLGETNPEILIPRVTLALDNTLYSARVGSQFSRAARLLVEPIAPVIVNQPVDQEVIEGQSAFFTAASTSSVVQTLQWQRCAGANCNDLANETATSLLLVNVQPADDGAQLRMCASNRAGNTCSRAARLGVIPRPMPPVITQQPQPITVPAGSTANFTVLATGGSLSYEWQFSADGGANFTPAAAGTAATFTIPNAALADDGLLLRVRVFNSAGFALSTNALLTVRFNPGAALTRVLGGNQHSIGLRADGSLLAWGQNTLGQLGDGTFDTRTGALVVAGLADVATFATGANHSVALRTNGEVWTWGDNADGELGDGTTTRRATPQQVMGLGPARAATAGQFADSRTTVALADGTVWSWGHNLDGQLGDGTTVRRLTPVRAGTLTEVTRVAAGGGFTLALRNDGSVWAWGKNTSGQLGNGTTTASLVPTPVPLPSPIVAIASSLATAVALTDQGTVLAWGLNVAGEIGDGTRERKLVPTPVSLPAPAIAIAAGANHVLALLLDGRVFAWGGNVNGQCASGSAVDNQLVPAQVPAPLPANIVAIGAGTTFSLALAADGSVWGWGSNSSGQLNDGATGQREAPVQALNLNLN